MGRKKIEKSWWAPHLPHEILGLILGKMRDPCVVDIIRFRAVCKNWRHVDMMIKHGNLPWVCHLSWSNERLECELYDPFSRQIFKTSKMVETRRYTTSYSKQIECLGWKQRWLIAAYHNHFIKWEIFMYNPYTTEYIPLPFIWKDGPGFATFSGDPVSRDCRVFVSLIDKRYFGDHYIAICGLDGEKEWALKSLGKGRGRCCGMQYVNEQVFCLFNDGSMIRYSLADGSCTQILLDEGSPIFAGYNLPRLLLAKGNLLVATKLRHGQFSIFHFDWSSMSWVGSDAQESSAVFISDKITIFVRPFQEDYDENNQDCKLYFFKDRYEGKRHPSYHAFTEMRKHKQLYSVFIDPPLIN